VFQSPEWLVNNSKTSKSRCLGIIMSASPCIQQSFSDNNNNNNTIVSGISRWKHETQPVCNTKRRRLQDFAAQQSSDGFTKRKHLPISYLTSRLAGSGWVQNLKYDAYKCGKGLTRSSYLVFTLLATFWALLFPEHREGYHCLPSLMMEEHTPYLYLKRHI
jgi:hypothetical protein